VIAHLLLVILSTPSPAWALPGEPPPELIASLGPVCGGTTTMVLFGWAVLGLIIHRRPRNRVRGIRVGTLPLEPAVFEALGALPPEEGGDWGWARSDGHEVVVFADPYARVPGQLRLQTPWQYVGRIRLDGPPEVELRIPTSSLVLLLLFLPLAVVWFPIAHALQRRRLEQRLRALADLDVQ